MFSFPSRAFAQSPLPNRGASQSAEKAEDRIANLKDRANNEIDRRIKSLSELVSKISLLKKISESQKTSLTTQITEEINNLTSLKAKISSDTDLATTKTDAQSIVKSYRIYALFIPKINILAGADAINETSLKLSSLSAKLQVKISEAKSQGNDVSSLESSLKDMNAIISQANSFATNAVNTVMPLNPEGFPGNLTTLKKARDLLQTGHKNLVAAYTYATKIIQNIKVITTNKPSSSSKTSSVKTNATNSGAATISGFMSPNPSSTIKPTPKITPKSATGSAK